MPIPQLINGWTDVQADPQKRAHCRRLIAGVGNYNRDAAAMVKYLSEFVTLSCAPDLLAMRVFPNGKEISESFGAYDAARYRLQQYALNDRGVTVVCVGDGRTPRTAATFAMRSAWDCYSIDPIMKGGTQRWKAINRLTTIAKRIEDVTIEAERVILVAVHSHANLRASLRQIRAREISVIAIPCCVRMDLDTPPDLEYQEKGIISPCRTVKIWKRVA